ncbi:MAG: PEP-CTERM sorting domain-containing protein [Planctomycetota bacterium]
MHSVSKAGALVLSLGAFGMLAGTTQAAVVAYEGFDYTVPNTVDSLNGGTGWTGAWSDLNGGTGHTFDIVSPGQTYTDGTNDLVVSGNAMIEDEQNTGSAVNGSNYRRTFDNTGLAGDGTDLWVSYVVNIEGGGSHGFHLANSDANFGTQISRTSGDVWRLQVGGTGVNSTINAGGQTLVLLKIDYSNAANSDVVSVWFNPSDISTEPLTSSADLQLTGQNIANNSQLRFFAGNFPTSVTYDEIRIATTFEDAVPIPEPGTMALGAAGLAMLARRRRTA